MGKSNKFDFTNRGSGGVKLGRVIGDALKKEVEKAKKDADRQAAKVRKQSIGSVSSVDPGKDLGIHVIDLKAPSKQLSDEGVRELAQGLEDALRAGTSEASLSLEDINLQSNELTTESLALLAPVIKLAKHDLKTINLASNKIQVHTDHQALQWETFLLAFKDCFKLRRLDLSGNKNLGPRALEILARLHRLEPPITPLPPGGDLSVLSLAERDEHGNLIDDEPADVNSSNLDGAEIPLARSLTDACLLKRRCGLRSIPYLSLCDIGLTDSGALWLSFAIQDHFYPEQLIDDINAAPASSNVPSYQQIHASTGIEWEDNDTTLHKDGIHLLNKTEALRKLTLLDDKSTLSDSTSAHRTKILHGGDASSAVPRSSRAGAGNRRTSMRSIDTDDGGERELAEVDSTRHKIQRQIIQHDGVNSVELWRASITLVALSRRLLLVSPVNEKIRQGAGLPVNPEEAENILPRGCGVVRHTAAGLSTVQHTHKLHSADALERPKQVLTDVSNFPSLSRSPPVRHCKNGVSEGSDGDVITKKLGAPPPEDIDSEGWLGWQRAYRAVQHYRDTTKPYLLPQQLFEQIAQLAVGTSMMDLMSEQQRIAAFTWGQDKSTLTVERDWMKMTESAQILKMLDSIKCLSYDV